MKKIQLISGLPQTDWAEPDSTKPSYLKNKPTTLEDFGITDGVLKESDLMSHTSNTSNPHSVTKSQVGLGNVDNTSDTDKPVSTAQATAIADAINVAVLSTLNVTGIPNITIPSSVTYIVDGAFQENASLTSIVIPDSITIIGTGAFGGCSSLTSVVIPNNVTSIGDRAFSNCSGLTNITIGEGVTTIGESAFEDCESLTSIVIPNSVTSIGKNAFRGCRSLTNITIGNRVISIADGAFSGCGSFTSITIPSSVRIIGRDAFSGCTKLNSAIFTVTSGWKVSTTTSFSDNIILEDSNLSDTSIAARYLTQEYRSYYWKLG